VPHDDSFGGRQIRPVVILRKDSPSDRSDCGAATQAVLMSVYRTLRLRGLNPTQTIAIALRTYLTTGQLPPLPKGPLQTADLLLRIKRSRRQDISSHNEAVLRSYHYGNGELTVLG